MQKSIPIVNEQGENVGNAVIREDNSLKLMITDKPMIDTINHETRVTACISLPYSTGRAIDSDSITITTFNGLEQLL